jgi:hypothetical protein
MSKKSIAPKPAPVEAAVPSALDALTITWQSARSPFIAGERLTHRITGSELWPLLAWLAYEVPSGAWKYLQDPQTLGYEVLELAELCRGLEQSDLGETHPEVIFGGLSRQLRRIGNLLAAEPGAMPEATCTVQPGAEQAGAPAPKAVA